MWLLIHVNVWKEESQAEQSDILYPDKSRCALNGQDSMKEDRRRCQKEATYGIPAWGGFPD
jgi:hypothetical protein